jgi:uncharacterized protein
MVTNSAVGMPCPVCKVALVMSDRQGVEIDYCPQCRGVWLDRGELDKIIERSAQAPFAAPAPQERGAPGPFERERAPHHGDDDGRRRDRDHRGHGRKSFFEELFD